MVIEKQTIDREFDYSKDSVLISKTDTKGKITFVSPDFAFVSGYKPEELIGKPHNIIRHPDMPKSVFMTMWETIESGEPWHGFVKNRRKNGEYYWVEATVLPIREGGHISGYISIRKKPSRKKVHESDALYKKINSGYEPSQFLSLLSKTGLRRKVLGFGIIFNFILFINFYGFFFEKFSRNLLLTTSCLAIFLSLTYGFYLWLSIRNILDSSEKIQDQLTSFSLGNFKFIISEEYAFPNREMEKIYLSLQIAMQGVWGTLVQIKHKASEVFTHSERVLKENQSLVQLMQEVSSSSEEEMASLEQISSSIHEVWQATQKFSADLKEINLFTTHYFHYLESALGDLIRLNKSSQEIAFRLEKSEKSMGTALGSMQEISSFSKKIEKITIMITDIANKTNLLSLNAAIEAERAGDHGKGFAVVAGEISKLADETTLSVKEIKSLIQGTSGVVQTGEKQITQVFQDMKEIHGRVSKMIHSISEISAQMKEQLDGGKNIQGKYAEMANHTHIIENAIQEEKEAIHVVTKRSETLSVETTHLSQVIEEFEKLSKELSDNSEYVNSLVDHFDLKNN